MEELTSRRCKPCDGDVAPLKPQEVENLLKELNAMKTECGADRQTCPD